MSGSYVTPSQLQGTNLLEVGMGRDLKGLTQKKIKCGEPLSKHASFSRGGPLVRVLCCAVILCWAKTPHTLPTFAAPPRPTHRATRYRLCASWQNLGRNGTTAVRRAPGLRILLDSRPFGWNEGACLQQQQQNAPLVVCISLVFRLTCWKARAPELKTLDEKVDE